MASQTLELETVMQQLAAEHEKLLRLLDEQQAAMKQLDHEALGRISRIEEAARLRISALESRRRAIVTQLGRVLRMDSAPSLVALAEAMPDAQPAAGPARPAPEHDDPGFVARHIAGRLAGAVLGHLNTAVRILAGAVEQAGLYTKHGTAKVSSRIGVMETVG